MICDVCGKEYDYDIDRTPDIEVQEVLHLHSCYDCGIDIAKYIVKKQMINTAKKIGINGVLNVINAYSMDKSYAMKLFWEVHDEMYAVDPSRKEEENSNVHQFKTMSDQETLDVVKSVMDEDLNRLYKSRIEEMRKEVNKDDM